MENFKIYGRCRGCLKDKFFVRKAKVVLPNGLKAKSKDLMCGECIRNVRDNVK